MKFSKQRRQVLTGIAGVAAAGVAAPALSGLSPSADGVLRGVVVSSIYEPKKLLTLTNSTNKPIVIDQFERKAMMFDGEVVDCNAACLTDSIVVPANSEVNISFDKRKLFGTDRMATDYHRVQDRVQRLSEGTRVIPVQLDVANGMAKLVA